MPMTTFLIYIVSSPRVELVSTVFLKSKSEKNVILPLNLIFVVFSTPFGLYRDGTELRAVYYSRPEVAKAACDYLGNLCNYPILLGILAPF